MDAANRNQTSQRRHAAVEPGNDSAATLRRAAILPITGKCVGRECRRKTGSIVIWNGKAAFLCPPCGLRIRQMDIA